MEINMSNILMIIVICELVAVFVIEWARTDLLEEIKKYLYLTKDIIWDANKDISLIESWSKMTCSRLEEINKHIDAIYKEIYKNKSGLSDITIKDAAGNEYKFEQSMED